METVCEEIEMLRRTPGFRGRHGRRMPLSNGEIAGKTYPGKRMLDCLFSFPLLLLSCPAMLLTALWIRVVSHGPVLYRQTRMGLGGELFTLFKLRTMAADSECRSGPCWSMPNDPRVIPGGHLLRHWHLDELPQFWNILRGDMSLVGPRPERPEIVKTLEAALPDVGWRLAMKPGLTGLAQVTLPANSDLPGFRRKNDLDLQYIRRACLGFDLRILGWTVLKVLGLRGSWVYPRVADA